MTLICELERDVREREAIMLYAVKTPQKVRSRYSRELRASRRKLAALDARRCGEARLAIQNSPSR